MKIVIGADHGGFFYKEKVKKEFEKDYEFIDVGAYEINETDNYAEFSFKVGAMIQEGKADFGIMICRTGVGAVIALNKMKGIRAGVLEDEKGVYLARSKNNINVLSFGADNVSFKKAKKIVEKFLTTEFDGGRHIKRLEVIANYEEKHIK